jgi:hypothetical protein
MTGVLKEVEAVATGREVLWRRLRIFRCGDGRSRDTPQFDRAITTTGSTRMAKPQVYRLDLKALKEPDDLWGKLFLLWLKSLSEDYDGSIQLPKAVERAVTQLDKAVSELLPEKPDELRAAMKAIRDVQEAWKQQSERSLENTERLAVIGKQLMAKQ